jgi:hypothetical protein
MGTIQGSGKVREQAAAIQRRYYTAAAARYDCMHAPEGGTDASITKFIYALAAMLEVRTILDVGTATGATVCDLKCAILTAYTTPWSRSIVGPARVILIPTTGDAKSRSWFHRLLTSSGILVCALRENRELR